MAKKSHKVISLNLDSHLIRWFLGREKAKVYFEQNAEAAVALEKSIREKLLSDGGLDSASITGHSALSASDDILPEEVRNFRLLN